MRHSHILKTFGILAWMGIMVQSAGCSGGSAASSDDDASSGGDDDSGVADTPGGTNTPSGDDDTPSQIACEDSQADGTVLSASVAGKCATGCVIEVMNYLISSDETWNCKLAPYHVKDNLFVRTDATLTLAAGVTLSMGQNTSVIIGGASAGGLIAQGAADAPVKFTSSQSSRKPGDWEAIVLEANTKVATLDYVTVEYGGKYATAEISPGEGALQVVGGQVTLTHSTFRHNSTYGVVLRYGGMAVDFHDNTFSDNPSAPVYAEAGAVTSLRGPNTFDATDSIHIPSGSVSYNSTWNEIGAPYRVLDH